MMIMIVGPNPGRACKVLKQGVEMCHSFGFEEKGCLENSKLANRKDIHYA